jgi:hypothetical protein
MELLLKPSLSAAEIQFFAVEIRGKLRLDRSVSGSASGSTAASVNPFWNNYLLERAGSGKKPQKGGNDPGFVILNRLLEVCSSWSFPPFRKLITSMFIAYRQLSTVSNNTVGSDGMAPREVITMALLHVIHKFSYAWRVFLGHQA